MNTTTLAFGNLALFLVAIVIGRLVRRRLPETHLNSDSKDAVKVSLGLVATMTALLLSLLVSSAKMSYDSARGQVIQMAAKLSMLDRMLAVYGPEAAPLRTRLNEVGEAAVAQIWPESGAAAHLDPDVQRGNALFAGIQMLTPGNDIQRVLKGEISSVALKIAETRTLLAVQALPSVSKPLLMVVLAWLFLTFVGFSTIAPSNATAITALIVSALSVSGAMMLILELDRPFDGLFQISNAPMVSALKSFAQ